LKFPIDTDVIFEIRSSLTVARHLEMRYRRRAPPTLRDVSRNAAANGRIGGLGR
jgi:hypothetical protein